MPPIQYQSITEKNWSKGIQQNAAEALLPPGYVEDALNVDAGAGGELSKRKGYEPHASIPLRVTKYFQSAGSGSLIDMYFDKSVDLSRVVRTPLLVYGRLQTSAVDGDFGPTAGYRYYPTFFSDPKFTIPGDGVPTNAVVTQEVSALASPYAFVGVTRSTVANSFSNEINIPESVTVSTVTNNVTTVVTNSGPGAIGEYIYVVDNTALTGKAYNATFAGPFAPGPQTVNVPAGTHNLANAILLVQTYQQSGTDLVEFQADTVTNTNGDIAVTWQAGPVSLPVIVCIRSVPESQSRQGTAAAGSTATLLIENLSTPFLVVKCFSIVDSVKTQCLPESVVVDADARTATVTFTNATPLDAAFLVVYEYGQVRTNRLSRVVAYTTPAADISVSDNLELTVYGLQHSELYPESASTRAGWVTALDSYRSAGESYLCATLGWDLFREAYRIAEGNAFGLPSTTVNARQRASVTRTIAPLFHGATDTVLRTRGGYKVAGAEEGYVAVQSVAYAGTPGQCRVTLATPGRVAVGTESGFTLQEGASTAADLLTLTQSVHSRFDGDWSILSVDYSTPNTLVYTVRMSWLDSADFDFVDQGQAGVFTDLLLLQASSAPTPYTPPFVGSVLSSTSFDAGTELPVVAVPSGTQVLVGPVQGTRTLANLQLVTYRHTGRVVYPTSIANFVRGDVLTYVAADATTLRRSVQHLFAHEVLAGTLTVSADGTWAYLDLSGGTGSELDTIAVGQILGVEQAGRLAGEWQVALKDSTTRLTLLPNTSAFADIVAGYKGFTGQSCVLTPRQLQVNLAATWNDNEASTNTLTVESRFVAVENPGSTSDVLRRDVAFTPKHMRASPFDAQPLVKTTMAADSLFATNYADPVLKYDGAYITRAGLPRWQPGLFLLKQTGSGIQPPEDTTTAGTTTSGIFRATVSVEAGRFAPGSYAVTSTGQFLTVESSDAATGTVRFKEVVTGTPTSLAGRATLYRYYFRASAIDANNNIMATATSGSQDFVSAIVGPTTNLLRIAGIPSYPGLDYDRLRIEVYRTRAGGVAPFYRIATLDQSSAGTASYDTTRAAMRAPYMDFADSVPDSSLSEQDSLTNAFTGGLVETFNTIEPPPRAKYITTVGNKAAYGNIRSWPRVTMQLVGNAAAYTLSESWVVRKDSADTSTLCNQLDRVGVRFVDDAETAGHKRVVSAVSTSGTGFTVTLSVALPYLPVVGQWVYLTHPIAKVAPRSTLSGWWQVYTVASTSQFTVRCTGLATYTPTADDVTLAVFCTQSAAYDFHMPVYLGADANMSTRADTAPVGTAGNRTSDMYTILTRASRAFNAGQNAVDSDLYPDFVPWLAAFAGNDLAAGTLQLEFPTPLTTVPELELGVHSTVASSGFEIFGNGTPRSVTASIGGIELLKPSRVLLSFNSYPDVVDAPFVQDTTKSNSAVDVNPSDGQEITAVLPFFGESSYGAAQNSSVLVVFKTDSIYVIDTTSRAVQRLETQGIGCAAPASCAQTRQGIIFAHTSGLYRLTRQMTVEPIGANLTRLWQGSVLRTPSALEGMQAHNHAEARSYRMFFPRASDLTPSSRNSDGFTYDYTEESATQGGTGGWTRLDNHAVTNFANIGAQSWFATPVGTVCQLLTAEVPESYRDDGAPIGMREEVSATGRLTFVGNGMQITLRALDLGDSAIRKRVLNWMLAFRMPRSADGTGVSLLALRVSQATDLVDQFEQLDQATLQVPGTRDGLSSTPSVKQLAVRYSPSTSKGVYFQVHIEDAELGAPVQLVSLSARVTGLSSKGTAQAVGGGDR